MDITKQQIKRAADELRLTSKTIEKAGKIHAGELYAQLKGRIDIPNYNRAIRVLRVSGTIVELSQELIWAEN